MCRTVSAEEITTLLLELANTHALHGGADESLTTCTDPNCATIRAGVLSLSRLVLDYTRRTAVLSTVQKP